MEILVKLSAFLLKDLLLADKVEMVGIDPTTSRMQSERSTIWATSPITVNGTWTHDHVIKSHALYQLSYSGK